MGRTIPTFRNMIDIFGLEWNDFKRALRYDDKKTFEDLLNHARKHGASGTNMVNFNPFESIVISILIEHEKLIRNLDKKSGKKSDIDFINANDLKKNY